MSEPLDVLIAGGGMVGASLATALLGHGLSIGIVEASAPVAHVGGSSFDDRHTALSPSSRRIFEALGLWGDLVGETTPIAEIHVSDRGRFGFTRMRAADEGLDALGWVAPNRVLGKHLTARLDAAPGVHWYRPARVTAVTPGDEALHIEVSGEEGALDLPARLLVVADGARSATRDALGIGLREREYGQHAIIANVRPARPPQGRAFERFTPDGPLAVLPVRGGECGIVWTRPEADAEAMLALDDAEFLAALQAAFGYRLGRFEAVGARASYPLTAVTAERFVGERAVLLGNAAHTLHPVAGQGFNLALRDVASLAETLVDAVAAGADPGAADRLATYERHRRGDYRRTFTFTDGLVRMFSNRLPVLVPARNAGLVAFDLLPGARNLLMRQAMGRGGWQPRLARGLPLAGGRS